MSKAPTETEYSIPGTFPALALLSDLHGRDYQPVIASLKKHRPAIICVTGDFIYGSNPINDTSPLVSQPNVLPFLAACNSIAPTYVSLGNHERVLDDADLHAIGSTGVTVLDNRYITTTVDGFDLVIGGLTSPYCLEYRKFRDEYYREAVDTTALPRYPKKIVTEKVSKQEPKQRPLPDTSWLAEFASAPGYHILLSHHPEFVDEIVSSTDSIDLILSGHAHGGQWRVYHPIKHKWFGVFAPGQGIWPKLTEGVHEISSGTPSSRTTLVISRGLANTSKMPRFFNRPEVVYISGVGKNCGSVNDRGSVNIRSSENKPAKKTNKAPPSSCPTTSTQAALVNLVVTLKPGCSVTAFPYQLPQAVQRTSLHWRMRSTARETIHCQPSFRIIPALSTVYLLYSE